MSLRRDYEYLSIVWMNGLTWEPLHMHNQIVSLSSFNMTGGGGGGGNEDIETQSLKF